MNATPISKPSALIGRLCEYKSGSTIYEAVIMDKVTVMGRGEDEGKMFDLFIVQVDDGSLYKISPVQLVRVLED